MIFLKKLSFMLAVFLILSCSKTLRQIPCTTSTSIEYSACNASNGCTLSFSCPTGQYIKLFELLSLKKIGNFLMMQSNPNTSTSTTMQISSMTINQPALLQATSGDAPANWYNNSIDCINDEGYVTCANFLPIANDFTVKGIVDNLNVTLHVIINNTNTTIAPACGSVICGQIGTTVQRMFDCSQRVVNFAGIGNGDGTFNSFISGNPDPNWFLVSSPSASDSLQEECFWLSPILDSSNPAAGINQFDSNGIPISIYANSPMTKGRFLWSGMSTSTYNFFEANGYNPRGTTPTSYDYYYFTNNNVMAQQYNAGSTSGMDGPLIYSPQDASTSPQLSPIICAGTSSCYGGNSSIYNLYFPVAAAQSQSPCSTNTVNGMNLLSGTAYAWQMPSYPMMMTLTGGNGSSCETSSGSTYGTDQALCNGGVGAGAGISFNAQDPIPNFANSNIFFWSSSISDPSGAWYFEANGGGVLNSLTLDINLTTFPMGIRCVSATW